MITYSDNVGGLRAEQLTGFFVGWPVAPSATTLLRVLQASYRSMVAIDDDTGQVVGVINALSDGLLAGFIRCWRCCPAINDKASAARWYGACWQRWSTCTPSTWSVIRAQGLV
jgi:hypothetical protein